MNTKYFNKIKRLPALGLMLGFIMAGMLISCEDNQEITVTMGEPIELSVSNNEVALSPKDSYNDVLEFAWTSGTNQGTGASIAYQFEMDLEGNNFSQKQVVNYNPGTYASAMTAEGINALMLDTWGVTAGQQINLEIRIIAMVNNENVLPDTSDVVSVGITTYEPLTPTLYIIGDATTAGWDASNATALERDSKDPTVFTYVGALSTGNYKFIASQGDLLPSYNMNPATGGLYYRLSESDPDDQFSINESAKYKISIDLFDLSIVVEQLVGPAYDVLYLIGDATTNGWDMPSNLPFTQNPDNLFEFTYKGVLEPGNMKIATYSGGWCGGDEIRATVANQTDLTQSGFIIEAGCSGDDNQWAITEETQGLYTITVNIDANTITFEPFRLFMVGSATPNGWDISSAVELVKDATSWNIFTYTGPLVEGEFKLPVNRNSDWGQDMYMKDPNDASKMYLHNGGDDDDEKWSISATEAGDYIITVDILNLTIDLQKQ
ncbi:SusF/SusE family outer membrane protein [Carboxylicivirga caseinilyticus]|uniref:SusF/SusE family outer membrane protein n=1 Tax=Carboxylicivirga caseinilyticus TaxID=3417572 RepID=UPI003D32EEDC|nr:SusF/SusE family outer membrane protein [Marinilabiliaceae bacterium A049]